MQAVVRRFIVDADEFPIGEGLIDNGINGLLQEGFGIIYCHQNGDSWRSVDFRHVLDWLTPPQWWLSAIPFPVCRNYFRDEVPPHERLESLSGKIYRLAIDVVEVPERQTSQEFELMPEGNKRSMHY